MATCKQLPSIKIILLKKQYAFNTDQMLFIPVQSTRLLIPSVAVFNGNRLR